MAKPLNQRDKEFRIPAEIVVDLKVPLRRQATDAPLEKLRFHPPTVGEMVKMQKISEKSGASEGTVELMVLLSEDRLTDTDIRNLNFVDFLLCQEELEPFFALSPPSAASDG
jgi:hypothetical protein